MSICPLTGTYINCLRCFSLFVPATQEQKREENPFITGIKLKKYNVLKSERQSFLIIN